MRITLQQAASVMPQINDAINEQINKVDTIVSDYIIRGFDFPVADVSYHFNFDDQDQANFTQELIRAALVVSQGTEAAAKYRAQWRGHLLDGSNSAVTLSLNMQDFQALAMHGGTWKGKVLQYGWFIKNELAKCKDISQVAAIAERFKLDELSVAVRDGNPYTIDLSIVDSLAPPTAGSGTGDSEGGSTETPHPDLESVATPNIHFAQNDVLSTIGTKMNFGVSIDDPVSEDSKNEQFTLYIWARNCIVSEFGPHAPYGSLDPQDPSNGTGQGINATIAELQEIVKNIKVESQDEYGVVMVSLYPTSKASDNDVSEQFFIQSDALRNRLEVMAEIDAFNAQIPPMPEEIRLKMEAEQARVQALIDAGKSLSEILASGDGTDGASTTLPEIGDTPTTLPEVDVVPPKKELWQMAFYYDKSNFLKSTITEFEAAKAEFEAAKAEAEAAQ